MGRGFVVGMLCVVSGRYIWGYVWFRVFRGYIVCIWVFVNFLRRFDKWY